LKPMKKPEDAKSKPACVGIISIVNAVVSQPHVSTSCTSEELCNKSFNPIIFQNLFQATLRIWLAG